MSEIVQNQYSSWQAENSAKFIYNGYIYVGQVDTDPLIEANQVRVYYIDENEQEVNLTQPIRTNSSGFPVISETNSTVIQIRTDSDYSVKVLNKSKSPEWYIPKASSLSPVFSIEHNKTTDRGAVGAHDDIYERTYPTVALMQAETETLETGIKIKTYAYNRDVECAWEVVNSEANGYGEFSLQLAGGKWAKLRPGAYITPSMVGAPASPADSTSACIKAAEFFDKEYVIDGLYGISGSNPITFREGQRVNSINGPVTGGSIKAAFIALSPMAVMVDLSAAKYADIHKIILDGASSAQRGFKSTNVFGLSMSQCRTVNLTVTGYEFVNDGTGTGSFINSITKCYASLSPSGFVVSSAASESNLFVFNECVATDCTDYGFREFGDNTGRDNAYNDCDAEKCNIGFLMRSRSFNLVNPYVEFCNKGIVVDATGLASGVQTGRITSPSILGKFNFPGVPTGDSIGIELIGFCRNVVIDNPWVVYHKKGIVSESTVTELSITEPFLENNDEDYDIQTKRYKIRKGNQTSSILSLNNTNNVTVSDIDNTIFVDLGNNVLDWNIDISSWLNGHSIEFVVMGDAVNTGTLTVSGVSGETFFGQNAGTRVGGATSVVFDNGRLIKFIKQNENTIYFVATQA